MLGIIVLVLILTVLGGITYYIARRSFQCLRVLLPKVTFMVYIIVYAVLTLLMMMGFARSLLPVPAWGKQVLKVISAYYMGIFIYLFLYYILADVAVLICRLCKRVSVSMERLRFISGIVVMVLTFATVEYGILHAQSIKVVKYEVDVQGKELKQNLKIVMVSDLHLGAIGSEGRLPEMVEKINGLEPDLVCIVGDIFDNDYAAIKDPEAAIHTLRQIKSEYGVYACPGNHDSGETVPQMQQFLDRGGIHVLNDTYVTIGEELVLVGRLDSSPIGGYKDMKRKDTDEVLTGIDTSFPVVVMDHSPANIGEYGPEVDLILSGHTHKGQMFPGGLFTAFLFEEDHGYYRKDTESPHVIVSSGVGTWGMPMRVGTDCEVVQILIQKPLEENGDI